MSISRDELLSSLDKLSQKLANGDADTLDELDRMRTSIANNLVLNDLANHDGLKILVQYINLQITAAKQAILNKDLYFSDKDEYLRLTDLAWNKIESAQWFLTLLAGPEKALENWQGIINQELNK